MTTGPVATSAGTMPSGSLSDLAIARSVKPRPIIDVARDLGLHDDEIEPYGSAKAKITLAGIERLERERPRGKYVLVTGITPTPLGEGKSTTTVGLAQGLNKIGHKAAVCIRQPSLGPVFGIKGGAAGGGYSQVIPMEDFNLHLTGDVHAIGAAHNLAAAFIDNHIHHGNALRIDALNILWPRVLDISDRALRKVVVGLGGKENGYPRETEFVITVASEVMAVLALARDLADLRARLGRIVLATTRDGAAITAEDLKVAQGQAAQRVPGRRVHVDIGRHAHVRFLSVGRAALPRRLVPAVTFVGFPALTFARIRARRATRRG